MRPAAASASELVYDVAKRAGLPVSRAAAEALWVGIATDTGRFCYDSVSPSTMRAAACRMRSCFVMLTAPAVSGRSRRD